MDPKTVGISRALNLGFKIQWNKSLVLSGLLSGQGAGIRKRVPENICTGTKQPQSYYGCGKSGKVILSYLVRSKFGGDICLGCFALDLITPVTHNVLG